MALSPARARDAGAQSLGRREVSAAPSPGRSTVRGRVIGGAVTLFVLTLLLIVPRLGTELIPQMSQGEFNVDLRLPAGTPLEVTDRAVDDCAARERRDRGRRPSPTPSPAPAIGSTPTRSTAGENTGRLSITLEKQARVAPTKTASMAAMRQRLERQPGVQYQFSRPSLFALSTPLEVVISGYDLDRLRVAAEQVRLRMQADRALRRHQVDRRGRQPRDPDRLRPGRAPRSSGSSCATSPTGSSTACAAKSPRATRCSTRRSTCSCAASTRARRRSRKSAT